MTSSKANKTSTYGASTKSAAQSASKKDCPHSENEAFATLLQD